MTETQTDLRKLSDQVLHERTKALVAEERKVTTQLLHHLREIDRRRLYAAMGFPSLFEYTTRVLGYAEASAYRRIAAMRLMKDIPEVEEAIESGRLSVSVVSQAQTFFRAEPKYNVEQKRELLSKLEGMSKRQCDQFLMKLSPAAIPKERARVLTDTATEIRFIADHQLLGKFDRVRGFLAHKLGVASYSGLFEEMADLSIKSLDPRTKKSGHHKTLTTEKALTQEPNTAPTTENTSQEKQTSRHIPSDIRREVWLRDQGQCTYVDPKSHWRCRNTYALQIDHIQPFALGGRTELANLRLLCRAHNQLLAIRSFGQQKMNEHLGE